MSELATEHCDKCNINFATKFHSECPYCKTNRLKKETKDKEAAVEKKRAAKKPVKKD